MLYTFETIKRTKKISGICGVCNKRKIRTIKAEQTVNPYNKNEDGTPKNYHQVEKAVCEQLVKNINEIEKNFICATCFNNLPYPRRWPPENNKSNPSV